MSDFRIGVVTGGRLPIPDLVSRWQEAEELGFDTVWVTDHFITGDEPAFDAPIQEAWTLIAGLAMVTSRIRFGVMVTGNTYRNPALLLKEAITVDHLSNGRLEFGVGAGWWVREHEAYGYEMAGAGELVDRFREALEIWDGMQRNATFDYHGKYYFVTDAPCEPKPIQQPTLPLVIGASGPRMMRLVAKHANTWNTRAPVATALERSQLLDAKCAEVGRDPKEISRSIWPMPHPWDSLEEVQRVIAEYREAGFNDFVFTWPPDDKQDVMRQFAREILPELRSQFAS